MVQAIIHRRFYCFYSGLPFIPFSEQENIFNRLKRRAENFKCIEFEVEEITKTKHKNLLSFIKHGLKEGTNVIFATFKRPYHKIQGELLINFEELKNLMIIDLYENRMTLK